MNHKYPMLLTPLRAGNVVIRTRMGMSKCNSQEHQGPENFPAEGTIKFSEEAARNGASVITMPTVGLRTMDRDLWGDAALFPANNAFVNNYFIRLIDRVHAHGSLCSAQLQKRIPSGMSFNDPSKIERRGPGGPGGMPPGMGPSAAMLRMMQGLTDKNGIKRGMSSRGSGGMGGGPGGRGGEQKMMSVEDIKDFIEDAILDVIEIKALNLDMISLSPIGDSGAKSNNRTDEYGGSLENRCRATTELVKGIKEKCGPDFLIEMMVTASDDPEEIEKLKIWAPYVDIYHIRAGRNIGEHPSSYVYDEEEPPALAYTTKCKAAGVGAIIAAATGFQDPAVMEKALEDGRCDMFYLARPFNCDPDYLEKIIEGRGEDIIPCLRCDNCHSAICAVNPRFGLENVYPNMFRPSKGGKKVAVIGGGPAGMRAALTCAERGHKVTLFEKSGVLGGQAIHADYVHEKWAMKRFKDWLIDQINKAGVEIKLNTAATADMIDGKFDAVIAATGAAPKKMNIPGGDKAMTAMDVFGNEKAFGKNVVMVGGTMTIYEAAIYLVNTGHNVTVITRDTLGHGLSSHDANVAIRTLDQKYAAIKRIQHAQIVSVDNGVAVYTDKDGKEGSVPFDTVVVNAGFEPQVDAAQSFFGTAPQYYVVGDADVVMNSVMSGQNFLFEPNAPKTGNMRHANFSAFMAANNI